MTETNWLWVGAIGMLAGSLLLFAAGGHVLRLPGT